MNGTTLDDQLSIRRRQEDPTQLDVTIGNRTSVIPIDGITLIIIQAGDGNDQVQVDLSLTITTKIYGGAGNDTIRGGGGSDRIYAGDGNDWIGGYAGNDVIYGEAGNDRMFGGDGRDYLVGGPGADVIRGEGGVDQIIARAGEDDFRGNLGDLITLVVTV